MNRGTWKRASGTHMTAPMVTLACIAALLGCAPEPPSAPPEPAHTADDVEDGAPGPSTTPGPSESEYAAELERTASGTLVPLDGATTGRIVVTLEESSAPGDPSAHVTFTELSTPHARLGVGGALEPRGEDSCFDVGIRSGGGDIHPHDGLQSSSMPFTGEGWEMTDVVLTTNGDGASGGCLNTVVARAALEWAE